MSSKTSPSPLTYQQIRGLANKFLQEYHPRLTLPVPIEEIVELKLRIKLSTVINLKTEYGCDGFINSDFTEITLDDEVFNKYEERARFTIAHELGHKFLHSRIYQQFKISTKNEYLNFQNRISEDDQKWLEIQAHIFAACVLVPTESLKDEVTKALKKVSRNGVPQIDYSIPYLRHLPLKFKVSADVVMRRIQRERLLKDF